MKVRQPLVLGLDGGRFVVGEHDGRQVESFTVEEVWALAHLLRPKAVDDVLEELGGAGIGHVEAGWLLGILDRLDRQGMLQVDVDVRQAPAGRSAWPSRSSAPPTASAPGVPSCSPRTGRSARPATTLPG